MKNRNGFTLIELIVIIVILGIIMVFALPNITSTLERNKKDQMIIDAKDMVEKARNYILSGKVDYPTAENPIVLKLSTIDIREEIIDSPFGHYDRDTSKVTVTLDSGIYKYNVCLQDAEYTLQTIDDISELNSDDKYTKINKGGTC